MVDSRQLVRTFGGGGGRIHRRRRHHHRQKRQLFKTSSQLRLRVQLSCCNHSYETPPQPVVLMQIFSVIV